MFTIALFCFSSIFHIKDKTHFFVLLKKTHRQNARIMKLQLAYQQRATAHPYCLQFNEKTREYSFVPLVKCYGKNKLLPDYRVIVNPESKVLPPACPSNRQAIVTLQSTQSKKQQEEKEETGPYEVEKSNVTIRYKVPGMDQIFSFPSEASTKIELNDDELPNSIFQNYNVVNSFARQIECGRARITDCAICKNHMQKLSPHTILVIDPTYAGGYKCDFCYSRQHMLDQHYVCLVCNYDICSTCENDHRFMYGS